MATVTDSARIASMAKKRKIKSKSGRSNIKNDKYLYFFRFSLCSNNEIDIELSPAIKEFIEKVHTAYVMYLKVHHLRFFFYNYQAEITRLCS
jgi:hypothetical protein